MSRYSITVERAFDEIAHSYHADSDGHWVTLKDGFHRDGGQIVHEWTVADMLVARKEVEKR